MILKDFHFYHWSICFFINLNWEIKEVTGRRLTNQMTKPETLTGEDWSSSNWRSSSPQNQKGDRIIWRKLNNTSTAPLQRCRMKVKKYYSAAGSKMFIIFTLERVGWQTDEWLILRRSHGEKDEKKTRGTDGGRRWRRETFQRPPASNKCHRTSDPNPQSRGLLFPHFNKQAES